MTFEDRLDEFEERTSFSFQEVDVSGAHAEFFVRANPDASFFSVARRLDIRIHSVTHQCERKLYRCRVLDTRAVLE